MDLNVSAMLSYNALNRVKAQTGSRADTLCGEKRLVHMGLNFWWNARAVVADLHDDAVVLLVGTHPKFTGAVHGVDRIVDNVSPDLVEFTAKGIHQQRDFLVFALYCDSMFEFVVQDGKSGFKALDNVDVLDGCLVHERV